MVCVAECIVLAFFTKFTYIDILTNKPYERVAPVLNRSDDFEIELFTGFYDIAGKKVYEGDVLGYDVRGEYANCSVFYNKDKAMFVAIVHDEEGSFLYEIPMEKFIQETAREGFSVVANIHRNLELLEPKDSK